jgi:dynein heavy chain
VSHRFLGEVDLGTEEESKAVMQFMPYSFSLVAKMSEKFLQEERRFNYTTPKTFLELIKLYKSLLSSKRTATENNISRLSNGLDKLMKTQKDVDVLVEQAKVKAVEVAEKVKSSGEIAATVDVEKAAAQVENDAAQVKAAECAEIAAAASAKAQEVEKEVQKAIPLVEQAQEALKGVDLKDLQTMKAMGKLAPAVEAVISVLIILLDYEKAKDLTWKAGKQMVSNPQKFLGLLAGDEEGKNGMKDMIDNNLDDPALAKKVAKAKVYMESP